MVKPFEYSLIRESFWRLFGGYVKDFGFCHACFSPLSSQESDWKDLRECASLVLLSEKQVTSSGAFPASAEEYNSRFLYRTCAIHSHDTITHTVHTAGLNNGDGSGPA